MGNEAKQPKRPRVPGAPTWATECPTRRPEFKVHTNIGHAKNAVTARMMWGRKLPIDNWEHFIATHAVIDVYEMVDGEWLHHPEMSVGPDTHEFAPSANGWDKTPCWVLRRIG